jgi:hypothetical protein
MWTVAFQVRSKFGMDAFRLQIKNVTTRAKLSLANQRIVLRFIVEFYMNLHCINVIIKTQELCDSTCMQWDIWL